MIQKLSRTTSDPNQKPGPILSFPPNFLVEANNPNQSRELSPDVKANSITSSLKENNGGLNIDPRIAFILLNILMNSLIYKSLMF